MRIDLRDDFVCRRSSSAPKKAAALLRISFARRSSPCFSFSSSTDTQPGSTLVTPGDRPRSHRLACLRTQFRTDSSCMLEPLAATSADCAITPPMLRTPRTHEAHPASSRGTPSGTALNRCSPMTPSSQRRSLQESRGRFKLPIGRYALPRRVVRAARLGSVRGRRSTCLGVHLPAREGLSTFCWSKSKSSRTSVSPESRRRSVESDEVGLGSQSTSPPNPCRWCCPAESSGHRALCPFRVTEDRRLHRRRR